MHGGDRWPGHGEVRPRSPSARSYGADGGTFKGAYILRTRRQPHLAAPFIALKNPILLVRAVGLEPTRRCHRGILSPLRLPVPPRPLVGFHSVFAFRHQTFCSKSFDVLQIWFTIPPFPG
jgi:hypothetical protein